MNSELNHSDYDAEYLSFKLSQILTVVASESGIVSTNCLHRVQVERKTANK